MKRREIEKLETELRAYLTHFVEGMGRTERREALRLYVTGLLLDGERKSIEPIAGRLVDSAAEIEAMRQRLQQAVVVAQWPDEQMLARLATACSWTRCCTEPRPALRGATFPSTSARGCNWPARGCGWARLPERSPSPRSGLPGPGVRAGAYRPGH